MPERLKDTLFSRDLMDGLADAVHRSFPDFDRANFLALLFDDNWDARRLKQKLRHTAVCLHKTLPNSYEQALKILRHSAPSVGGFPALAFPEYVQLYGMDDWDLSLPALGYLTRYGSAEFAVRPYLREDPHRVLAYMSAWAEDRDCEVRRLASEGCRPRLPWGIGLPELKKDPTPIHS